jgi:hypothetical protein
MSLPSESWPRCPGHYTWMQPMLRPRQWHCNVFTKRSHWKGVEGVEDSEVFKVDDGVALCRETERYRWWRHVDRRVFALLEVNEKSLCHYYCPICEAFFSPDGKLETKYSPPYFRLCRKCLKMGTENEYGRSKEENESL